MNIEILQTFLGWCAVIHIAMLLLVFIMLTLGRNWVMSLHQKMFALPKELLLRTYFNYIAAYKILVLVFVLVPYVVIRFLL